MTGLTRRLPGAGLGRAVLLVVVAVAVAVVVLPSAGCGPGAEPTTTTGPSATTTPTSSTSTTKAADGTVPLSVEEALTAEAGQVLRVTGFVVATAAGTVLASALAESMPPQPAGAVMPVAGLSLDDLVGLSSTAGQSGLAETTWSEYPVVLEGVVAAGILEVRSLPRAEEVAAGDITIRFSAVNEPVFSGGQAWWALDMTNTGTGAVELTFPDGQRGDVILSREGTDVYIWSAGKAFDQAIHSFTLEPGMSLPVVLNDTMTAPAGTYEVTARVTAVLGPVDGTQALPDLTSTLVVH